MGCPDLYHRRGEFQGPVCTCPWKQGLQIFDSQIMHEKMFFTCVLSSIIIMVYEYMLYSVHVCSNTNFNKIAHLL